jgi:transposase
MSRYDLTDFEWRVIEPLLPNKPRGVPRVDDRRVLNGIFWVLRSGAPWRDLLEPYGPSTTCYNRANIPPQTNRKDPICFSPFLYKARNLVERFFNKAKQFRRVATRYDKLAVNYLAAIALVALATQWLK